MLKIFMTGSTGYIGSAVTAELVAMGYEVFGLVRSERSKEKLKRLGGIPIMGSLSSLNVIKKASGDADAILHLGFDNNFHHFYSAGKMDERVIKAMGSAIAGTNKPLIVTHGTTGMRNHIQLETDPATNKFLALFAPRKSEITARKLINQGINAFVVRLPPAVHGQGDHGFTTTLLNRVKQNQVADYLSIGQHDWSAVHCLDAAHLFCLVLNYGLKHFNSDIRIFNAVADESLSTKLIAETMAKKLSVPVKAHKNPFALGSSMILLMLNCPASNQITCQTLGWKIRYPGLLADISSSTY